MTQLNSETGLVLVEKFIAGLPADGGDKHPSAWVTVSMSEIHVNDVFRLGGYMHGRYFKAISMPTDGPIVPGVWQVAVEEIVFEE